MELNVTNTGRDCMVGLRFQTSSSLRVVYRPVEGNEKEYIREGRGV